VKATTRHITGTDNVRYLRVSSSGQVNTDYNPEGISIPAQRVACERREQEVASLNVKEFVDPGKSAKTIAEREDFQEMIAYIKAHPNVKYVSIYMLSRFARNRMEDALIMMALKPLGVSVLSATERNIDDTPTGKLVHGMLAVINEYEVDRNGEDIKFKMGQKVLKHGGTLGKASIGYLNVREEFDGRRINSIAVDTKRALLIQQTYELFATDEYTIETLLDEMTLRGLTMPKTLKLPERPVSRATFGSMLRDRYYLGEVHYQGAWYPGRHTPIITPELFERVQLVLDSHSGSGIRTRKHHHYLKGVFWCKRCGSRFGYQRAKGNGGVYYYFFCHGSRHGKCDQPYVPFEDLEREMLAYYARVTLSEAFRQEVASKLDETLLDELATQAALRKRLSAQLAQLDKQEDRYIDQLGDPDWPQEKLKARVAKLRAERARVERQLADVQEDLSVGRQVLTEALGLLANPRELYRQSGQAGKRLLTRTLFAKLYVDTYSIVDHELNEPFGSLMDVQSRQEARRQMTETPAPTPQQRSYTRQTVLPQQQGGQTRNRGVLLVENASAYGDLCLADLLDLAFLDTGSDNEVLVGDTGIEPVTSSV
jgi:site-specific DNA recombinase